MATLAELAVKLTTDISEYTGGLKGAADETAGFAGKLERNWVKVTAGGVAAGATLMKLTGDSLEYNKSLRAMELQTGMTEQSQRSMIRELTDASFAHEDAVRGMERLIQAGVKEEEQFRKLLPVFDTLADALGIDITDGIETMDAALSALGIPLEESGDHIDTLTFLAKNSTADFKQLGMTFRREQGNIRELGLSFDDVAVALAAVEAEGIKGPRAVMALQSAMQDAEGDANLFWKSLGVTTETLDAQRLSLESTAGMTEKLAEINNSSLTWWDELTHSVKGYGLELGTMLEPARDLGPVLMGLGPAIKAVSVAKGFATVAATGLWGALVPLLPIIIPLVAIAGVLFLAWKNNWFDIQGVTGDAIEWITGAFDTFVEGIRAAWAWLTDWWHADTDTKTGMVRNLFRGIFEWMGNLWRDSTGGLQDSWSNFTEWWNSDTSAKVDGVSGLFRGWADTERERWNTLTGNLRTGWDGFTGWLTDNTRTGLDGVRGYFQNNRTEIEGITTGQWTILRFAYETGQGALQGVMRAGSQIMQGDWEGGMQTLRNTAGWVWDDIKDLFHRQMDVVAGIFRTFGWEGTGRDIINGIVDGIKAGTKWMTDTARWAARQALNAMKGALGISSPAKIPRKEIGVNMTDSVALGVEDEMPSTARRIESAFNSMVNGISPVVGFSQDFAGAGAGGPSIHLEVVVQGENATYEGGRQVGRGITDELRARGVM